jgi:hypothetical protein
VKFVCAFEPDYLRNQSLEGTATAMNVGYDKASVLHRQSPGKVRLTRFTCPDM